MDIKKEVNLYRDTPIRYLGNKKQFSLLFKIVF